MEHSDNPCAEFGPTQRAALVWCIGVLIGGTALTVMLSRIDAQMWESKAHFLDYKQYSENREAATTVGSEGLDSRARGDVWTARARAAKLAAAE